MALAVPLIYHSVFLNIKEVRYSFIFLPYMYILAGMGYNILKSEKSKITKKNYFLIVLTVIIILQASYSLMQAYSQYAQSEKETDDAYAIFDNFLDSKDIKGIKGRVWSTTPALILKKDIKIDELMYYPVFDSAKIEELNAKMNEDIQYIFLNYCDIPCVRNDAGCQTKAENFIGRISSGFRLAFDDSQNGCGLEIYEWKNG